MVNVHVTRFGRVYGLFWSQQISLVFILQVISPNSLQIRDVWGAWAASLVISLHLNFACGEISSVKKIKKCAKSPWIEVVYDEDKEDVNIEDERLFIP